MENLPIWKSHNPYIKPTRHIHDSGFRTFEVGYLKIGHDGRVEHKKVLGEYSDHIYTDYAVLTSEKKPFSIDIDLTKDGYLRFFSHQGKIGWDGDDWVVSSARLKMKE